MMTAMGLSPHHILRQEHMSLNGLDGCFFQEET